MSIENSTFEEDMSFETNKSELVMTLKDLLWIMMLIVNLPVFFIVPKISSLHYSLRCIMISLAVADFTFGIQTAARKIYMVTYKSHVLAGWFCKWDAFFTTYTIGVSMNSLALINLDKCLTLKYLLHYKHYMTKKKILIIVSAMWIVVFIMSIQQMIPLPWIQIKFYEGGLY